MPRIDKNGMTRITDKEAAKKAAEFKTAFPGTSVRALTWLAHQAASCYRPLDTKRL